ncbi:hypothetical protein NDU88_003103 [Pleurodeles waltl]|uniref:Uncharacterized protein n=1 Tax=Pleurodeles waltl TaxID=8319 RepID=A0AAV7SFU8_PLEWA|nr:hypothetical protein NDU88_003103 [Pleurodeles waltl]
MVALIPPRSRVARAIKVIILIAAPVKNARFCPSSTYEVEAEEALASRFTGRAERSFERSALPPLSSEERVSLQRVSSEELGRHRCVATETSPCFERLRFSPQLFTERLGLFAEGATRPSSVFLFISLDLGHSFVYAHIKDFNP